MLTAGMLAGCGDQSDTSDSVNNSITEKTTEITVQSEKTVSEENPETTAETEELSDEATEKVETTDNGNILVVYYSAQEHTRKAAELVADELNADVFVITPTEIYTDADLDWTDEQSRVCVEHEDENRHTELVTTNVDNWDSYDTVLFGYPIWWGEAA